MKTRLNLAIDGPSGAGKSTVARAVARTLGILYLDTGAMYRAFAWFAQRAGVSPANEEEVSALLPHFGLAVHFENGEQVLFVNGERVDAALRLPEMSKLASDFSALPAVRRHLLEKQRAVAREQDCVLDGRDIGSFVLPQAPIKVFLTADLNERARRRHLELQERGTPQSLEEVTEAMAARDRQDSQRSFAPLCQAPDAVVIDSTHLDIDAVRERIVSLCRAYRAGQQDEEA